MMKHYCKKNVWLVIVFLFLGIINCKSQSFFVDSIKKAFTYKPTADARLDGRNSFLTGNKTPISGVKLGLDFNSKFALGVGWQWISDRRNDVNKNVVFYHNDTITRKTKLHYFSVYAEYVFYKTKHWEFSIMPQVGFGTAYYSFEHKSKTNLNAQTRKTAVFIYEPMMSGSYKIFKYAGVGADLGWRFTLNSRQVVKELLTSPIYSFHVDIYWWTIYKSIFKKKKGINKLLYK